MSKNHYPAPDQKPDSPWSGMSADALQALTETTSGPTAADLVASRNGMHPNPDLIKSQLSPQELKELIEQIKGLTTGTLPKPERWDGFAQPHPLQFDGETFRDIRRNALSKKLGELAVLQFPCIDGRAPSVSDEIITSGRPRLPLAKLLLIPDEKYLDVSMPELPPEITLLRN